MSHELRLYKDEIAPAAVVALPARARTLNVMYVVSGALRVRTETLSAAFSANSAFHTSEPVQIFGGNVPTVALRWELAAAGAGQWPLVAEGISSVALLTAPLSLVRGREYLLRCDRVDFPPSGVALLHMHQGSGIRCLLCGGIEIDTGGARHGYGPLQAWFEAGPDPVYATASPTEPSAFVRLMVLPRSLLGKSSIVYVDPEDLAKPKSQRYQVFIDVPIELPR